jgi:hypothetical protein
LYVSQRTKSAQIILLGLRRLIKMYRKIVRYRGRNLSFNSLSYARLEEAGRSTLIGSVYVCGAIDGEAIGELLENVSLIEEVVIV